jgi:hypothetical protein
MAGATTFKLKCDNNGLVVHIDPDNAPPIPGKCVGLSTQITANGVAITQVVMETDDSGTCTWKKVGNVWVCA